MGTLETPWNKARKQRYVKQEERLNKLQGGRSGINSGRHWRWKRDGTVGGFLVECRETQKRSYTISYDEFQAITRQAYQTPPGMLPAMQIDIMDLSLFVTRLVDHDEREIQLAMKEGEDG
jgi:hypothetical protein